jgi:hypothetical protein
MCAPSPVDLCQPFEKSFAFYVKKLPKNLVGGEKVATFAPAIKGTPLQSKGP